MPASNAEFVQARVCSKPTPPEKVSHEPSEISETSRSEEPSLRYLMMLLTAGTDRLESWVVEGVVDRGDGRASGTLAEHRTPPQARGDAAARRRAARPAPRPRSP